MANYPDNYVALEIGHTVKLRVGLSTYLFTADDYAAIADAIFCNPPADVVWQSRITTEMVSNVSPEDVDYLIQDLDESVERYGSEYAVN